MISKKRRHKNLKNISPPTTGRLQAPIFYKEDNLRVL